MCQIAHILTDAEQGILTGKGYQFHDRDPLFAGEFLRTLDAAGVKSGKFPLRSPNPNPKAGRFVRSIKQSCLDRMIFFRQESQRTETSGFRGALLLRVEPSGPRESDHLPGGGPPGITRCHPAPSATGRHAERTPPRRGLIGRVKSAIAVRIKIQTPEGCAASWLGLQSNPKRPPALGTAGCGLKCEFSRCCEEMYRLADQGNEGNPIFETTCIASHANAPPLPHIPQHRQR